MFKQTSNLLAYQWWERVTPQAYPMLSIASLRLALESVADLEQLSEVALPTEATGLPMYQVSSVSLTMAEANAAELLGKGVAVEGDLLGAFSLSAWGWFVTGLPDNVWLLGSCPEKLNWMRGVDFVPYGKGYLFAHNPVEVATVVLNNGSPVACFACAGGTPTVKHRAVDRVYYLDCNDAGAVKAINKASWTAGETSGVASCIANTVAGFRPAYTDAAVEAVWVEGGYRYLLTSAGELLRDTNNTELSSMDVGSIVVAGNISETISTPEIYSVPVGNRYLTLSYTPYISASAYPELLEEYPELAVDDSGHISTDDLYISLRNRGILIRSVTDPGTAEMHRGLELYGVADGGLSIQQVFEVSALPLEGREPYSPPGIETLNWAAAVRFQLT